MEEQTFEAMTLNLDENEILDSYFQEFFTSKHLKVIRLGGAHGLAVEDM